jgi:hypothetical protein
MQNHTPYVTMVVGAVLAVLSYFASTRADDENASYGDFWEQAAFVLLLVGALTTGIGLGAYAAG